MRKNILRIFCISLLFSFSLWSGTKSFSHVNLRGYGKVKYFFQPEQSKSIFICQSNKKADILMGKLLADMFWNANNKTIQKLIKIRGKNFIIHIYPPYGAFLIARDKNKVIVIGAKDEQSLKIRINQNFFILDKNLKFIPSKPYPEYLDFYDLKAFKSYTHVMSSPLDFGLKSHWPFVKKYGLGGLASQFLSFSFTSPASGVINWVPIDYGVKQADKNKGLFVIGFSAGGDIPFWVYNQFPFDTMKLSPTALEGWGGAGASGASFQSWGMPLKERWATALGFGYDVMERYKNNPFVGGWHIYAGSPGGEMAFHGLATEFYDFSPSGEAWFRQYLRNVKKYSLKYLGKRWYGKSNYFKTWQQVTIPDPNSFFGNLTSKSFLINKHWQWLKAKDINQKIPASNNKWIPVSMPPSQQQDFLPSGSAYYKVKFNPSLFLSDNKGKNIFLIIDRYAWSLRGTTIWLNGQNLGIYNPKKIPGPIGLEVTGLLNKGENTLIIKTTGAGKIYGPVFLTTHEPKYYPYLGEHADARYVDLKQWQAYSIYKNTEIVFTMARMIDPNRPIILSDGSLSLANYYVKLASHFGTGLQFTGQGGFYFPWDTGLGYVNKFYGTSEFGGTITSFPMFQRALGWILFNGESNFDLFWDLENYMEFQKKYGWFTKDKRLIQVFGKSIQAKPKIIIFRSALTQLLGLSSPWVWDIGRGELQSAHYDFAYATEPDIKNGLIDNYPVLFDSGSQIMRKSTINDIKKYVEQGGTFIALQDTGRNTPTQANTWPISRLTGFKVLKTNMSGNIIFDKHIPIFKNWQGKEFYGQGSSLDYLNRQFAHGVGLSLQGTTGTIPIARWENGTVAIGMRKIGKGKVIILGSTFWRNGKDVSGQWKSQSKIEREFFKELFRSLGIKRNAKSDSSDIWTRKFITKNGLQYWLITFNSSDRDISTNVYLRVIHKPREVFNITENNIPIKFHYIKNGWIEIKGVPFSPFQTIIFGVKRADIGNAIPFWFWVKTRYWSKKKINKNIIFPISLTKSNTQDIPFYKWKFFPDKNNTISQTNKWELSNYNDSKWQTITTGIWNLTKNLKNYKGVGLYRAEFTIPKSWKDHNILLGLYSFNDPIVYNQGNFYINGTLITKYTARGWNQTLVYNITGMLKPGENVLSVKVKSETLFGGIGGVIWIMPEVYLNPYINLKGTWEIVKSNYLTKQSVSIPGTATGKYLVKDIKIPKNWIDGNIYLHIQTSEQWLGSVVINGMPVNYNSYLHPFGLIQDINLTPYIKFGKTNKIELWPYATIANNQETNMNITKILIGREKR